MRTKPLRWSWIGILALAALVGCGDSKEWQGVKRETAEAWSAAKAWSVAKRADAEKVFASSVDSLAKQYEVAKEKAKAAGKDASASLDPKWEEVKRKMAELKDASADKWEQARDGFVKAYETFKREVTSGS